MKALTKNDYEILFTNLKSCLRSKDFGQLEKLMIEFERKKYKSLKNGNKEKKRKLRNNKKEHKARVFTRLSDFKANKHENKRNNKQTNQLVIEF